MSVIENGVQKPVAAYVINLVATAVNCKSAPVKPEKLSWESIIAFAKKQNVLNIVSYACETLAKKPDAEMMKYLREYRKQKIVVEAEQEVETCDVTEKLESMGIRHMPLKGYIVKNLYPSPDMRTMSDIDILVEPSRIEEAVEALKEEGFTLSSDGDLHCNIDRGNAHFEFHRALVNESYKNLTAYFGDGFTRAVKSDGYNYKYELSREDMYIFLLAHLAKHYRYGGTGIRTVLDLYVYRKAYPDMDTDYIHSEAEKIGLEEFREKAEKIADDWFGGSFDGTFDSVSGYIISGGVYGKKGMNVVNQMINSDENVTVGKIKSIMYMLFPDYQLMSELFPILKKYKFLMPLFWIVRWFKSLTNKNSNLKNTINISSEILNVDDEAIAAQRDSGLGDL